jgi:glycosyltransferase involved in cell wall biosynthesis
MVKLSILVTYHDEGLLLQRCLKSLEGGEHGSCAGLEVIVFDDASSLPADAYVDSDHVRVVRSARNIGPARARNRLLAESSGEYIHFHDADDTFSPGWLQAIMEAIHGQQPDWIVTGVGVGGGAPEVDVMDLARLRRGDILGQCLCDGLLVPSCTFKRELLASVGGFTETLWQSEDWDLHLRLALRSPRIRLVDERLVHTFVRSESRSQNRFEVYRDALSSLSGLASSLSVAGRDRDVARVATRFGFILQRLGRLEEARQAYELARQYGGAIPEPESNVRSALVRILGPQLFEALRSRLQNWRQRGRTKTTSVGVQ